MKMGNRIHVQMDRSTKYHIKLTKMISNVAESTGKNMARFFYFYMASVAALAATIWGKKGWELLEQ